jgi:hypothetical protein
MGEDPWYLLDGRLIGPQIRKREKKKIRTPFGNQTRGLITMLTEIYRLVRFLCASRKSKYRKYKERKKIIRGKENMDNIMELPGIS